MGSLTQWSSNVLARRTSFMKDIFSMDWEGGGGDRRQSSGSNASEASLASLPPTSCCAAWFLTGHKLVLVSGPGVGDPCFKGNCLGPQQILYQLNLRWFLHPEVIWIYLPGNGTLSLGAWLGDIPPKFLSTTGGYRTSPFSISTPPTSLDACGFFNSVVVRFPFNSISDGST